MTQNGNNRRNYSGGGIKALAAVLLLTAAIWVSGFVWANSQVAILVDGKTMNVSTLALEPAAILSETGVYLGPRDEFRVTSNQPGKTSVIEVFRAIPVTLSSGSKSMVAYIGKPTVEEIVESQGYSPKSFKTIPDMTTRPTANMNIQILTLSDKVVEKELPVPFSIVRQPDPRMEKGMEAVEEYGVPGKKLAQVRQMYEDGQESGFDILSENIIQEPKPELLRVGTRDANDPSRGNIRFRKMLVMEASAYTPFDDGQSGITASGIPAKHGIVAVDPRVIPLGTRVYVMGYGPALAADTGGAIKGAKIDLCIEDRNEAIRYGRRTTEVYILAE